MTCPLTMDLAEKPLVEVLEGLPRLNGGALSEALSSICQYLQKQVSGPARDTALSVSAVFEALSPLPTDLRSTDLVRAFTDIARFYYMAAKPVSGIEPIQLAIKHAEAAGDMLLLCRANKVAGVIYAETGNYPLCTAAYNQALIAAEKLDDRIERCGILNNLGVANQYAAQFADATACFERARELAAQNPPLNDLLALLDANLALACLHLGAEKKGLQAARRAREELGEPKDAASKMTRVLIENYTTRLLLEVGAVEEAKIHAASALRLANEAQTERAMIMAEIAQGLTEVYAKQTDVGLTRLKRALSMARNGFTGALQDTLSAVIIGYEEAKQADVALMYWKELLRLRADAKQQQVLAHHLQHLKSVDRSADLVISQVAERHEATLRSHLAGRELLKARVEMLEQSALAAELHDDTTGEHAYRVGRLASLLAKEYGVEDDICFLIDLAARLHDIGKLGVPDSILLKPGKLTTAEFEIMMTHTTQGAEILARSQIPQMHVAEEIARGHHEKWDGTGYPHNLKGSNIPLAARIAALADVFDALTHERPYKNAWPIEDALKEISDGRGRHFDPELTDIFLKLVPELQRQHGDLDTFLAAEAKNSPFIKTRAEIARKLKGPEGRGIFDLRR
jgi:putative two-component system response regulator